jgi:hypothetical protein
MTARFSALAISRKNALTCPLPHFFTILPAEGSFRGRPEPAKQARQFVARVPPTVILHNFAGAPPERVILLLLLISEARFMRRAISFYVVIGRFKTSHLWALQNQQMC